MTATLSPAVEQSKPLLSGAYKAPMCQDPNCDGGLRSWRVPAGAVSAHCGCRAGRRNAEIAYGRRHNIPAVPVPSGVPA
ncbi:MAG TPA: hypothetical protein VGJ13_04790 [Pseudonocardiaceae bacterium]